MKTTANTQPRGMRSATRLLVILIAAMSISTLAAPAAHAITTREYRMRTLTNNERVSRGRVPLKISWSLSRTARAHSARMATAGRIFHRSNIAKGVPSTWRVVGENVGVGPTLLSVHRALMASPAHRANILERRFRNVGIGIVYAKNRLWVTQIFYG